MRKLSPTVERGQGRIAGELADFCVVTSDNSRFEDPFGIMQEIKCYHAAELPCPFLRLPAAA